MVCSPKFISESSNKVLYVYKIGVKNEAGLILFAFLISEWLGKPLKFIGSSTAKFIEFKCTDVTELLVGLITLQEVSMAPFSTS